jgi:tetratricopeptide (TPR) repeat protein
MSARPHLMAKILFSLFVAAAAFCIVALDFGITGKWERKQHGLWMSYSRTGDQLIAEANFDDAYKAYRQGLTIAESLAAADRANTSWANVLWVSHIKIGNVLLAEGHLEYALKAYRDGLAIVEHLAATDHNNNDIVWQINLMELYEKTGDLLVKLRRFDEALQAYSEDLAIAKRLIADRIEGEWQSRLSSSYIKAGNLLLAQSKLDDAIAHYHDSVAVAKRFATKSNDTTQEQRNLVLSLHKIGDAQVMKGKLSDAVLA